MTTKELIYFITIADEKSISKAARKLFLSQPSLSQFVKRIEESVGINLFNRTSAGLSLTYAGERYYLMATQVLKMYENFELEVNDINNLKTGRLNIGVTRHLGSCLLPKVLPRFYDACPNIKIHISEVTSALQEEQLLSGKLDFSLMHAPLPEKRNSAVNYELLTPDPFLIALPATSPLIEKAAPGEHQNSLPVLDISALHNQTFIMVSKGQRIRQLNDFILRQAGITSPQILFESGNFDTVLRCVASGLGVTLAPYRYSQLSKIQPPPRYFSIPPQYEAVWHLCISTSRDFYMTKAALVFIGLVKELC